jgi:hypothetical protein
MMSKWMIAAAALSGGMFAASAALATDVYDGNSVEFQYYAYGGVYNGIGSPASFTAPGSATFGAFFTVSVSGNTITYTYLNDTTWSPSVTSLNSGGLYVDNGAVIYSTGGEAPITSVKIDSASVLGISGFNASDVTFNSGGVAVTWMNESFAAGDTVVLDINTGTTVPEPATWAIMLIGVAGVGGVLRARRLVQEASTAA